MMMKQLFVFFIWFWACMTIHAQNLIVNGDLSTMNFTYKPPHGNNPPCNSMFNCQACVEFWSYTCGHSGGYFNFCLSQGSLPAQTQFIPGQGIMPMPVIGDGYFSSRILSFDFDSTGISEYVRCLRTHSLQNVLEKDSLYTLEFYARANSIYGPNGNFGNNWSLALINQIDVTFTDSVEFGSNGGILYPDKYSISNYSPYASWVGDYINQNEWTHIKMSFTASGKEKYMHIYRDTLGSISEVTILNPNFRSGSVSIFFDAFALYKASDTLFSVSIGNDTLLCPGEELTLTANLDDGFKLDDTVTTYLWNTGDTVPQITVNSPGTYWVEVTINHRFKALDSIVVDYEEPLEWGFPFDEERTIERCYSDLPITIAGPEASHDAQYIWSTGESTRTIDVRDEGYYHLRVVTECFDEEGSFTLKPVNCQFDSTMFDGHVYIPNAFTPNGRNPHWIISGIGPNTRVEVYNRWGQQIFESNDYLNNWWDGTFNGAPVPAGVYTYRIIAPFENKDTVDRVGTVTIVK